MSRETDFENLIEANAPIMAILTGGVHAYGDLGPGGLTRESVPAAFDTNGYLKPCCIVKMRAVVPDGEVDDLLARQVSIRQAVELWFYEDRGYSNIDAVLPLSKALFHGHAFSYTFPVEYAGVPIVRARDEGALNGASMARQDWLVTTVE